MRLCNVRKTTQAAFVASLVCILVTLQHVHAQLVATPINCGTILEAELTVNSDKHNYRVQLSPGDTVTARVEPIGQSLNLRLRFYDPQDEMLTDNWGGSGNPVERSYTVSATGDYTIQTYAWTGSRIGAYTLLVGCTLRDGTVISPGDAIAATPTTPLSQAALPPDVPGFPGLAPIDMSDAVKLPLIVGTPMTGIVTPTGNEVLGFSIEANAGDTIELDFRKLSGNLNLGVVVLSPDNRVVFYGGLVLADSLSTRFILQDAGQYTIGVYRVNLLPPAVPEATAFQVQGALVS